MDSEIVTGSGTYQGVDTEGAVVTDGAHTLFVADFAEEDTAKEAYKALKEVEDGKTTKIEGVLVVKRED